MDSVHQEMQTLGIISKAEQFQKQKKAMGIQNDYKDFMGGVVGDAIYKQIEGGEELRGTMQVAQDAYQIVSAPGKRAYENAKDGMRKLAYRTGEKIFQNQEQMMNQAYAETIKAMAKKGVKETGRAVATETTQLAVEGGAEITATAVGGGTAGPIGFVIGFAVGEITGCALDITGAVTSDRRRIERYMIDKMAKGEESGDRIWKVLIENSVRWMLLDLKYRLKALFVSILPFLPLLPFVAIIATVSVILFIIADPIAFGLSELADLIKELIP